MTITELAAALGVRTSTLRFWEQEGLAVPERVTTLRARQYGTGAIREARIVAALRSSGYCVPGVRDDRAQSSLSCLPWRTRSCSVRCTCSTSGTSSSTMPGWSVPSEITRVPQPQNRSLSCFSNVTLLIR